MDQNDFTFKKDQKFDLNYTQKGKTTMFKKLTEDARLPERATRYSCGFDVFANEDAVIEAGETKLVCLGIALDGEFDIFTNMPKNKAEFMANHYFALHIRSSLRAKGLTSLGTGIIDMDFVYPNEIKMVIHNPFTGFDDDGNPTGGTGWSSYQIKKGDKIGQLILCRHEGWLLPSEYTKDEERNGGFGSTGK